MQNQLPESRSTKKNILSRVWFWLLIGLAIAATLFLILLPFGIDYGIERYLKDQGADQVSLEDVDFNPVTGRMALKNLSVIAGSKSVLKIPQAVLDIEWRPFINKRFVLARLEISDTEITIQAQADGRMQIGGITLPDQNEKSEPVSWNFGLQQITVKNSKIIFISPQLASDIKIQQAKILKLRSWQPERKARLEFEGQLNDGNLKIKLDISPFGSNIEADGQIKLSGLTLKPFAQLLKPQVSTLEGRIDADLNIETRHTAENDFSHQQKGLLKLSQIRTQIADTEFSNESIAWDGVAQIDISKSGDGFKISTDGKLNGSELSMNAQNANMQIQQEQLNWEGKLNFEQTPAAAILDVDSALSLQNTSVMAPDVKLTQEKLDWKGKAQLSFAEQAGEQRVLANGNLASGPLTVNLVQQSFNLTHAGLDWQGKLDYAQEKTSANINTDGQLRLAAVKMESPQVNLTEKELRWKGALQFSIPAEGKGQRIIADGAIDGNNLQADLPERKLKLGHRGLSWKGRLDSGEANDFSSLKTEADFSLNDIEILQSDINQHLFNLEQADFRAIQIEGLDQIKVSSIGLRGLALLAELKSAQSTDADPALLRMQALEVKDIQLSQKKELVMESINMKTVKMFVNRDSEGKLPAIERLNVVVKGDGSSTGQSQPTASDTQTEAKSSDYGIRIGQIEITGDSKLRFEDESVSPAFNIDLSLLEASLVDLDSRQPEKPATLKLLISDGDDTRLSLDGTVQPFSEQLNLDWVGKIESLELPPLSPYVIRSTGYRFIGGEMEADIPVKVSQNQLEGKIDLVLYNPKVEPAHEGASEEKQGKIQLNMSLDSALKLMRDKQNNVRLNIPLRGDINDPKFSVADAVNKVLAKTLQTSALSYLKFMLGPYGLGISAAELAFEQATKIRLNPIGFEPGSDELDEAAIDYLKRVSAILKEHPTVQMDVCGVATESDRTSQKESASESTTTDAALLELAGNRTKNIKKQLVNQHGVAAKRIIACQPKIDGSAGAKPRADLDI